MSTTNIFSPQFLENKPLLQEFDFVLRRARLDLSSVTQLLFSPSIMTNWLKNWLLQDIQQIK